jgi:cold shock CspA family protein
MRFDGILTTWNEAAGSGIIKPGKGGDDIPVHISAFPRNGVAPSRGEPLSFAVEIGRDGEKRACNIARQQSARPCSRAAARHAQARSYSALMTAALLMVALTAALMYATMRQSGQHELISEAVAATQADIDAAVLPHRTDAVAAARFERPRYSCDGRTRCSQMKSCAEATFFLENCPVVEMDGDRDGVPCEKQWCRPGITLR